MNFRKSDICSLAHSTLSLSLSVDCAFVTESLLRNDSSICCTLWACPVFTCAVLSLLSVHIIIHAWCSAPLEWAQFCGTQNFKNFLKSFYGYVRTHAPTYKVYRRAILLPTLHTKLGQGRLFPLIGKSVTFTSLKKHFQTCILRFYQNFWRCYIFSFWKIKIQSNRRIRSLGPQNIKWGLLRRTRLRYNAIDCGRLRSIDSL